MNLKNKNIYIIILTLFWSVVSCTKPQTKEEYLNNFTKFVERVDQNHNKYNKHDWKWADEQFDKYNSEYYMQFKGEYKLEDQLKIKSLILEYHTFKNNENFGEIIQDIIKEDVDDVKSKIEDYLNKDAEKHLEILKEGVTEIGDSAIKVVEEIIDEIENKF